MSQVNTTKDTLEQPKPLLPNHVTIAQLALEINPNKPPCERSIYNLVDRLNIPYVKLLNERLFDRDVVRAAILASEVTRQPRGRGRRPIPAISPPDPPAHKRKTALPHGERGFRRRSISNA
jgi:hypothetical protein